MALGQKAGREEVIPIVPVDIAGEAQLVPTSSLRQRWGLHISLTCSQGGGYSRDQVCIHRQSRVASYLNCARSRSSRYEYTFLDCCVKEEVEMETEKEMIDRALLARQKKSTDWNGIIVSLSATRR